MSKEFDLKVTQEHLQTGESGNASGCAIALCLRDHYTSEFDCEFHELKVEVEGCQDINISLAGPNFEVDVVIAINGEESIDKFICDFDGANRPNLKPTSFHFKEVHRDDNRPEEDR